jgi:hypothetical protein
MVGLNRIASSISIFSSVPWTSSNSDSSVVRIWFGGAPAPEDPNVDDSELNLHREQLKLLKDVVHSRVPAARVGARLAHLRRRPLFQPCWSRNRWKSLT